MAIRRSELDLTWYFDGAESALGLRSTQGGISRAIESGKPAPDPHYVPPSVSTDAKGNPIPAHNVEWFQTVPTKREFSEPSSPAEADDFVPIARRFRRIHAAFARLSPLHQAVLTAAYSPRQFPAAVREHFPARLAGVAAVLLGDLEAVVEQGKKEIARVRAIAEEALRTAQRTFEDTHGH